MKRSVRFSLQAVALTALLISPFLACAALAVPCMETMGIALFTASAATACALAAEAM